MVVVFQSIILVLFYAYILQGSIFFKSTNFIPCTSTEGTSFLSNCLLKSTKKVLKMLKTKNKLPMLSWSVFFIWWHPFVLLLLWHPNLCHFLQSSFNWVKISLYTENQNPYFFSIFHLLGSKYSCISNLSLLCHLFMA